MAITFITGVPRSGKSYFSVFKIWQMYKNDLKKINVFMQWWRYYVAPLSPKTFHTVTYTNINQFNFDFSPRIKKLDFDDLISKLSELHDMNVNQKLDDDVLNIRCKELDLYDALIVIDEGAHYFKKPINDVIIWWLTYHGHMYQDVHIITQHVDQIPTDYLKNGEFFYKVYPPSKSIFKNKFSIGLYSCIKFYAKCKTLDLTIPFVDDVGKLYISGKKVKRSPILTKYIYYILGLIISLFWAISSFFSSNQEQINSYKEQNTSVESDNKNNQRSNRTLENNYNIEDTIELDDLTMITFKCIKKVCKTAIYENIPFSFLQFLIKNSSNKYIEYQKINYSLTNYNLLLDTASVELLDRSFKNLDNLKSKSKSKNSHFMGAR